MLAPPVSRSTAGLPSPQQTSASRLPSSATANFVSIEARAGGSLDGEAAVAVGLPAVTADGVGVRVVEGVTGPPVQPVTTRSGTASPWRSLTISRIGISFMQGIEGRFVLAA